MSPAVADRHILVTGATGAVGSALARRLAAAGARVRAMVRSDGTTEIAGAAELARADLADAASLRRAVAGCEIVIHCAAELSDDAARCQAVNVDGVRHLLAAMQSERCPRLVHFSSVSAYDSKSRRDFDEDCPLWSASGPAYGFSKAESERLVLASGLAATILRPTVVLSTHPRSYWGPLALERARHSAAPVWPLATVPYVHVESLADAVTLALENEAALGRAYDVIDGDGDARPFLAAIYAALARPAPPLADDAPRVTVRGERLRRELGFAPPDPRARWQQFVDELASLGHPGNTRPRPRVSP
jgi:nucleoside-diphosphate-sugar epimerase